MNDEWNLRSIVDGKECDVKLTISDKEGNEHEITGFVNEKTDSKQPEDIEVAETSNDNPRAIKINPVEFLNRFNEDNKLSKTMSRITFDKSLKSDHAITYDFNCDGTFALIYGGIFEGIEYAMSKATYEFFIDIIEDAREIPIPNVKDLKYVLGEITLTSSYGIVDLPAGSYPGEHDVVSIPIKCEYVA